VLGAGSAAVVLSGFLAIWLSGSFPNLFSVSLRASASVMGGLLSLPISMYLLNNSLHGVTSETFGVAAAVVAAAPPAGRTVGAVAGFSGSLPLYRYSSNSFCRNFCTKSSGIFAVTS
jgi:hypothetical protein